MLIFQLLEGKMIKSKILRELDNIIFAAAVVATPIAVGLGLSEIFRHNDCETLYQRAARLVDVNKDGFTSIDEWQGAYQRVNLDFNKNPPLNLTQKDLQNLYDVLSSEK